MNEIKIIYIDNLQNLDVELSYYYWYDKTILDKILKNKNNFNYFPCYSYENIDHTDLIDKYVILFIKKPKILYGIFKINYILIKNIKNKIFLDNSDTKNNSEKIIIDKENYLNLINKYKIVEIPGLFFIYFETFYVFKQEFNINLLNTFINDNKNTIDNFKYPKKIQEKHIIKSYYNNLKKYIIDYSIFLNNKNIINLENENENENENEILEFNIPILWNGCKEFNDNLLNSNLSKKNLINHWNNCEKCENNNNNNNEFNWNKKVVFKKLSNNNKDIFEKIINNYHNINNILIEKKNSDFSFKKDKINLVSCMDSKNIYCKCIFILYK